MYFRYMYVTLFLHNILGRGEGQQGDLENLGFQDSPWDANVWLFLEQHD